MSADAYAGHTYWISNFQMWLNGMLNQITQLPDGERRRHIEEHLRSCAELIESLKRDPTPDADLNLVLFSMSSATRTTEEEHAAHV